MKRLRNVLKLAPETQPTESTDSNDVLYVDFDSFTLSEQVTLDVSPDFC